MNGKHGDDDDDDDETGCVITDLNGNDLLELRNFNDHSVDSSSVAVLEASDRRF